MRGIVWFREDLRTYDNPALFHAAKKCLSGIIGVYIINPTMWHEHKVAACRIDFILRGLKELSKDLEKLNIPLLILSVKKTESIAKNLFDLIQQMQAEALFFNRQYEVNEQKRDLAVSDYLKKKNISCASYDDQMILPPQSVVTQQGTFYKVFTAYQRAWKQRFNQQKVSLYPKPKKQTSLNIKSSLIPDRISGFSSSVSPALWPAGEKAAAKKLKDFLASHLFSYDKERDYPALQGTSRLSPYLAAGMISARECFSKALLANQNEIDSGNPGALAWMNELIWRDFYKDILIAVPRISMNKPYQLKTENIPWSFNKKYLTAWQQGKTGFPIVDAAMRQLNETGWMHNRLRMITAMFLTKNLFLDWRLGEEYFMSHLIDGDLSANNGGWQWCASTGTDAVPYFRIFNPIRQSERYDPNGTFIRQYCPELQHLKGKSIHQPLSSSIVQFAATRDYAIKIWKKLFK